MKKIYIMLLLFLGTFLLSCGPSAEELKRQQEIEDSIAQVERESAIDKASQLLEDSDTLPDSTAVDTLIQEENM